MQKTIQYLGATIRIEVEPETSTIEYAVYHKNGTVDKEIRFTAEGARKGEAVGHPIRIRTETEVLSRVTITINGKHFASGEPKAEELKEWIEAHTIKAQQKINRTTNLKPREVLAEMGFE